MHVKTLQQNAKKKVRWEGVVECYVTFVLERASPYESQTIATMDCPSTGNLPRFCVEDFSLSDCCWSTCHHDEIENTGPQAGPLRPESQIIIKKPLFQVPVADSRPLPGWNWSLVPFEVGSVDPSRSVVSELDHVWVQMTLLLPLCSPSAHKMEKYPFSRPFIPCS